MIKGFVALNREMVEEFEWLSNPNTFYVFMRLLFKANYKDKRWEGIDVKRGQLVTGRKALSEELNLTERQIRTCLERLKNGGYIDQQTTNRYTIITICNFDAWSPVYDGCDKQNDQQTTNKRPTNDQQTTTPKTKKQEETKKQENKENIIKEKKTSDTTELATMFDKFRVRYRQLGGKARGLDTELENLKKKHKDWMDVIPLLYDAIEKENTERQKAKAFGQFFPEMKMLQTYINQRAWESYSGDDSDLFNTSEYRPRADGVYQRWNEKTKCLEVNQPYSNMWDDGYTMDNRPDGATIVCSLRSWKWSTELKDWVEQ